MHPRKTGEAALALAESGHPSAEIARRVGVAPRTVRDWLAGRVPRGRQRQTDDFVLRTDEISDRYVYLLGLYLGDGCLTAYPRGVFKLRIVLDERYPGIVEECAEAIAAQRPAGRVSVHAKWGSRAMEVSSYWKAWPVLFPQHGPGRKHHRRIALEAWQEELVAKRLDLLLRGLVHSDGCRFINTGRGGWRHARYSFTNRSADIRAIFCAACDRLDLHWTSAPDTVYVSRKADVASLDEFIGPKC
jgi:hypothetical protein